MERKPLSTKKKFAELYLTGKYTQSELCKIVGITPPTAKNWIKELVPVRCFEIRNDLLNHLSKLVKHPDYVENIYKIDLLINQINQMTAQINATLNSGMLQ